MKIYTYYENINFQKQDKLLQAWKLSWERMGFEAIILGLDDAKKHPKYDDFCKKMKSIFKKVTGHELKPYGLSCFARWLAYATVEDKESRFFVSDYDVINSGRWKTHHPITNKLHFYDSACPCLVSGNPKEFDELCNAFFDVTMQRITKLQTQANHYHDQEFFVYNFIKDHNPDAEKLIIKYNMFFSRRRCEDVAPFGTNCDNKVRAFHISHHNSEIIRDQNPEKYQDKSLDEVRLSITDDILSNNI